MNAPPAQQQQMPLQQAIHITNEVLGIMYKFFETSLVTTKYGITEKNNEALLSIKHCQLLMRPWMLMLQEEERLKKGEKLNNMSDYPGRDPSSKLVKRN